MNVYLLMAHPCLKSLNGHIADLVETQLRSAGHDVRRQDLADMDFDPVLRNGYKQVQPLEPSLQRAWDNILWCNKWIIVYPVWWGAAPALLKGFFDRVLLPGHAFRYHDKGPLWDKLLTNKSAHIITTSDAPAIWLWWQYCNSDVKAIKKATLEFCGIKPVKVTRIGRVRYLTTEWRERTIQRFIKQL